MRSTPLLVLALVLAGSSSWAGEVAIAWDPVTDPDLTGYRVFHGPSSGDYTGTPQEVVPPEATIVGLPDCQDAFLAVKALARGAESLNFSPEVSGWPRPSVSSVSPGRWPAGGQTTVTISGANFQSGVTVESSSADVQVISVAWAECHTIAMVVQVVADPTPGIVELELVNPDNVFGTLQAEIFTGVLLPPDVEALDRADVVAETEPAPPPDAIEVVVDNGDPGTSSEGYWRTSPQTPVHGDDARRSYVVDATYTWTTDLEPGSYLVEAFVPQAPHNLADARYTIGAEEVFVDQRNGTPGWTEVGVFDFDGPAEITLTSCPGYGAPTNYCGPDEGTGRPTVIADAIRWTLVV